MSLKSLLVIAALLLTGSWSHALTVALILPGVELAMLTGVERRLNTPINLLLPETGREHTVRL